MLKKEKKIEEEEIVESPKAKKGVKAIIFRLNNRNVQGGISERKFCEETHGENFEELAKSFEDGNTHREVTKPVNKDDIEGIAKFKADSLYNSGIATPIIEKIYE